MRTRRGLGALGLVGAADVLRRRGAEAERLGSRRCQSSFLARGRELRLCSLRSLAGETAVEPSRAPAGRASALQLLWRRHGLALRHSAAASSAAASAGLAFGGGCGAGSTGVPAAVAATVFSCAASSCACSSAQLPMLRPHTPDAVECEDRRRHLSPGDSDAGLSGETICDLVDALPGRRVRRVEREHSVVVVERAVAARLERMALAEGALSCGEIAGDHSLADRWRACAPLPSTTSGPRPRGARRMTAIQGGRGMSMRREGAPARPSTRVRRPRQARAADRASLRSGRWRHDVAARPARLRARAVEPAAIERGRPSARARCRRLATCGAVERRT